MSTRSQRVWGNLSACAVLSGRRRDREERRPCARPASPALPQPRPRALAGAASREAGVPRAPHLFQRRHQQPPPLGCVLLAEKLVRQLLRLHGAPGAPLGGERGGGGGRAGEPREGELAAPNRAAAPPDGPAPSGRRAAGLALERGLRGEARARPPTRHGHQPRRANAARRRRRRHPAPPPRGRAPHPTPSRPAGAAPGCPPPRPPPAGATLPSPAWPRGGAGGWGRACGGTLRPRSPLHAAATPKRERPEAERGRGVAGEGKGPRSSLEDLAARRCRRGRRRRRCSARASY